MPVAAVSLGSLTLERLMQAVEVSRKEVAKSIRGILTSGRNYGKDLIRRQFRRRSGRLFRSATAMKVSAKVSKEKIEGTVSPKPKLLNIFERGARIPSQEIAPKRGKALRFRGTVEGKKRLSYVFVRGKVTIPARSIAARPVVTPTRAFVEKAVGTDLQEVVKDVLIHEVTKS